MAPTLVQGNGVEVDGSSSLGTTLAFTSNVTAGSLLFAAFQGGWTSDTGLSVSDSLNGAWTRIGSDYRDTSSSQVFAIFYRANSLAGACTVTAVFGSGSPNFRALAIAEFSGVMTTSPLDSNTGADSNAGNRSQTYTVTTNGLVSTSITPTQNGALIVAAASDGNTWDIFAPGSGYSTAVAGSLSNGAWNIEYLVQGAAASRNATWTPAGAGTDASMWVVAFLPVVSAGVSVGVQDFAPILASV